MENHTYRPGITELQENKELGKTGVRLCEFLAMNSEKRDEVLKLLSQDNPNFAKALEEEEAYVQRAKANLPIFIQKMKEASSTNMVDSI